MALKSQNMCLGHACAVQITSGTDHMAHVIGGKIVRKGTQIHQESMTRTLLRKDMKKSGACLENVSNTCQKWCPKGWVYFCISPLGASWGSFGAPIDLLMQKVQPKSSQNNDKITKVTPKDTPWTQKCVKNCRSLKTWPGGLREALWICNIGCHILMKHCIE